MRPYPETQLDMLGMVGTVALNRPRYERDITNLAESLERRHAPQVSWTHEGMRPYPATQFDMLGMVGTVALNRPRYERDITNLAGSPPKRRHASQVSWTHEGMRPYPATQFDMLGMVGTVASTVRDMTMKLRTLRDPPPGKAARPPKKYRGRLGAGVPTEQPIGDQFYHPQH